MCGLSRSRALSGRGAPRCAPAAATPPDLEGTLVLALGNPLRGDDGVGPAVLAQLAAVGLPAGVAALDGGTPGLETTLLLQGYQRVIIVDAAEMGREPGAWARWPLGEARLQPADMALRATLHSAGLAEALALAEALGVLPPEVVIYGVQPAEVGWEPGLSAAAAAAVPAVSAAILDDLCGAASSAKDEATYGKRTNSGH